ncbi:MAG: hypothetical protein ACPG5T_00595 [Endozoicomonas sp.]
MNPKTRPSPNSELDPIRDTSTDLVNVVGETRRDIKSLRQEVRDNQQENLRRFDEHSKRFNEHDRRFDEHDKRFDQQDRELLVIKTELKETRKDIANLELLVRQLLPNASH